MAQGKIGDLTIVAGTAFKDAELKHVGDKGTTLCEFSLIVGKNPDGKGKFANCKAWTQLGTYAAQIQKGDSVCVIGTMESREYNGKTYTSLKADWLNIAGVGAPTTKGLPPSSSTFSELSDEDSETPLPF